jgi:hypothetical protein
MKRTMLVLGGLLLTVATAAQAQDGPRKISGRVFDDSSGCPLRGVRLAPTGSKQSTLTDANGRYRLLSPPVDTFSLQASMRGWATEFSPGLMVTDSSARVDFSLARQPADSVSGTVYPPRACHLQPRDSTPPR